MSGRGQLCLYELVYVFPPPPSLFSSSGAGEMNAKEWLGQGHVGEGMKRLTDE